MDILTLHSFSIPYILQSLLQHTESSIDSLSVSKYTTEVIPLQTSSDDTLLAERALAGDEDAFALLVERYGPALFSYSRRLTGNTADAEDIAQETLVRLHEHLPKLDLHQPLKPWLFHVCTNLCRNLAKKKKLLTFSQLESSTEEDEASFLDTLESTERTHAQKYDQAEQKKQVQAAIQSLPQKYQVVVHLYYFQQLSYEEISHILSLPLNTVRTHIRRAKSLLATLLQHLLSS